MHEQRGIDLGFFFGLAGFFAKTFLGLFSQRSGPLSTFLISLLMGSVHLFLYVFKVCYVGKSYDHALDLFSIVR